MNPRRVAYLLLTLSFMFIMSGSVSCFVSGLKSDRQETFRRANIVNDDFEEFSTITSLFEETRDKLYTEVLSEFYFDRMAQDDLNIKSQLSDYEKIVDKIEDKVSKLDNGCKDVYYPDGDVNRKCINYKSIYEQVVNYFVSDVNLYNKYVKQYNDYGKDQEGFITIEKYATSKRYIDYNKDKKYEGKEE